MLYGKKGKKKRKAIKIGRKPIYNSNVETSERHNWAKSPYVQLYRRTRFRGPSVPPKGQNRVSNVPFWTELTGSCSQCKPCAVDETNEIPFGPTVVVFCSHK